MTLAPLSDRMISSWALMRISEIFEYSFHKARLKGSRIVPMSGGGVRNTSKCQRERSKQGRTLHLDNYRSDSQVSTGGGNLGGGKSGKMQRDESNDFISLQCEFMALLLANKLAGS